MRAEDSAAFVPVSIALLTVSDTRTEADDTSGDILAARIEAAGHRLIARTILRDEVESVVRQFGIWADDPAIDAVISTGGTGLTGRDVTPEAMEQFRAARGGRDIPGFGELFRWISFETIGTATIQSRACAAVVDGTYLFALPGSNGAVKDGWDRILAPQLDNRTRPCNFVGLMPRLREH